MKSREERFSKLSNKIFQAYVEYLEECSQHGVDVSDIFNTALQALATQTSSIILQYSILSEGSEAKRQKKAALDICDKHYRAVRRALPELMHEAHLHAMTRQKGPWE